VEYGEVRGVGKPISRLVIGITAVRAQDREGTFRVLDGFLDLGSNAFDTAHVYGEGAERTLGAWVADRGVREEVVIIGKGAHPGRSGPRVTPEAIAADLAESLARTGTDYVDLYLLHRDDPSVPVGPVVEALNEHLAAGRVRAFGGSNWTHQRIREADDYAREHALVPFTASSPNFSLAEQVEEAWGGCLTIGGPSGREARAWYRRTQMPVLAWSSLARGFMVGHVTRENFDDVRDTLDGAMVRGFCHEVNFRRLDRARALAAEKGVTVPQLALGYVFNQGLNVFAIVGCRSREELEENLVALDLELTFEESAWLDLRSDQKP
jgi:aryl-alcohol dehydrogenase-like predicted oxidoreductase